jgi:hypothetical protein
MRSGENRGISPHPAANTRNFSPDGPSVAIQTLFFLGNDFPASWSSFIGGGENRRPR